MDFCNVFRGFDPRFSRWEAALNKKLQKVLPTLFPSHILVEQDAVETLEGTNGEFTNTSTATFNGLVRSLHQRVRPSRRLYSIVEVGGRRILAKFLLVTYTHMCQGQPGNTQQAMFGGSMGSVFTVTKRSIQQLHYTHHNRRSNIVVDTTRSVKKLSELAITTTRV